MADGLRVVAGFGIHGGEHLQDLGLAAVGQFGGCFELGKGIGEAAAGGEGAAEVVMALGGVGGEGDGFLEFGDGFVEFALTREDDAVDVVAVGILRGEFDSGGELLNGFVAMAVDFEKVAEVDVSSAVVGIELDGFLDVRSSLRRSGWIQQGRCRGCCGSGSCRC